MLIQESKILANTKFIGLEVSSHNKLYNTFIKTRALLNAFSVSKVLIIIRSSIVNNYLLAFSL